MPAVSVIAGFEGSDRSLCGDSFGPACTVDLCISTPFDWCGNNCTDLPCNTACDLCAVPSPSTFGLGMIPCANGCVASSVDFVSSNSPVADGKLFCMAIAAMAEEVHP